MLRPAAASCELACRLLLIPPSRCRRPLVAAAAGGTMPSIELMLLFQDDLACQQQW